MAFCPRTFTQGGSWIGTEHQAHSGRVLNYVKTAEEMNMAPYWKLASKHPYQYVRATRFSASRYWKESKHWQTVAQEQYSGVTNLPTSAPQGLRFVGNLSHPQPSSSQVAPTRPVGTPVGKEESLTFTHALPHMGTTCLSTVPSAQSVKSLRNVKNLVTTPDDTAALLRALGPLKFVGNLSLPAEVLGGQQHNMTLKPTQVPGSMTQEGIMAPRVNPIPSTSAAPVSLSTMAFGGAPIHSQTSSFGYTREDFLQMMEYHSYMASHYRELKSMAENMPQMMKMQSVSPAELQRKAGGVHDRSWDEETRSGDDGTGDIVLPDDAVEKLDAIPGILDLAREMGFLTLC
ncbi:hypothetical protein ACEWY4_000760 [Coilia grayii]|uniref:Uncharacterized protein n=1 Tax=Coilia grayii TaxID=363190 RepID=A0ABD1KXM0_9TELE